MKDSFQDDLKGIESIEKYLQDILDFSEKPNVLLGFINYIFCDALNTLLAVFLVLLILLLFYFRYKYGPITPLSLNKDDQVLCFHALEVLIYSLTIQIRSARKQRSVIKIDSRDFSAKIFQSIKYERLSPLEISPLAKNWPAQRQKEIIVKLAEESKKEVLKFSEIHISSIIRETTRRDVYAHSILPFSITFCVYLFFNILGAESIDIFFVTYISGWLILLFKISMDEYSNTNKLIMARKLLQQAQVYAELKELDNQMKNTKNIEF